MKDKVLETIREFSMLSRGDTVVVGLSGGADSVVLAHILQDVSDSLGIRVEAIHVNHGLRGGEADRDMEFVKDFCKNIQIPLYIADVDVKAEAGRLGKGIEETGRIVRYRAFEERTSPGGKIATAHTLSDCAETILLHIIRGTGQKGLCGIPPVRNNIIRPLFRCTREEVENYAEKNGLPFVTDSTNYSRDYARNRIRLDVIPQMLKINPSFFSSVARLSDAMRCDTAFFEEEAEKVLKKAKCADGYKIEGISHLHYAMQKRVILKILDVYSPEAVHLHKICNMIKSGNGGISVPGGGNVRIKNGILSIRQENEKAGIHWKVPFSTPCAILPDGRSVKAVIMTYHEYCEKKKINNLLFINCLNYDTITVNAVLRNRMSGDAFKPAGRGCTKSLKKLLNEMKVPPAIRNNLVLLECGGEIVWIQNVGVCETARVTEETKTILMLSVED